MRMSIPLRNALALLFCVAYSKNSEPPPPSTGSPNAPTESGPRTKKPSTGPVNEQAQQMFATVCATCHGADGTGNGPASQSLDPKPRNYTDAEWQATVTDDELRAIIIKGGQGVGKSAMMPGNPHLETQPEVVDGLVQIIRGFAKK